MVKEVSPVVFRVASCKLLTAQAVDAAYGNSHQYNDLRKSIVGLIFLGTPHYGSAKSAVGSRLAWLLNLLLGADGGLIRSMELHHPSLIHAHQRFVNHCQAYSPKFDLWKHSKCFYEQRPTMLMQGVINSGLVRPRVYPLILWHIVTKTWLDGQRDFREWWPF